VYHPAVRFVLASASPRRRDLLDAAGFTFDVDVADIDETRRGEEAPDDFAARLASEKAVRVAARHPSCPVIGADTIVVVDGDVLGKPRDADEAFAMLRRLSGRAHEVVTAVALVSQGVVETRVSRTTVWFRPLADREVLDYVASGEPFDKAGAYAIQGRASRFIPRIEGSYSNVVGLPIGLVDELLKLLPLVGGPYSE